MAASTRWNSRMRRAQRAVAAPRRASTVRRSRRRKSRRRVRAGDASALVTMQVAVHSTTRSSMNGVVNVARSTLWNSRCATANASGSLTASHALEPRPHAGECSARSSAPAPRATAARRGSAARRSPRPRRAALGDLDAAIGRRDHEAVALEPARAPCGAAFARRRATSSACVRQPLHRAHTTPSTMRSRRRT